MGDYKAIINGQLGILARLANRIVLSEYAGYPLDAGVSAPHIGCHKDKTFRDLTTLNDDILSINAEVLRTHPVFETSTLKGSTSIWPFRCLPVELRAVEGANGQVTAILRFARLVPDEVFVSRLSATIASGKLQSSHRIVPDRARTFATIHGRFLGTLVSSERNIHLSGYPVLDESRWGFVKDLGNLVDLSSSFQLSRIEGDVGYGEVVISARGTSR